MKKIKKIAICFLMVLPLIVMATFVACGSTPGDSEAPAYKNFNSFSKYKNFSDGVVAVEVAWDLGGSVGKFTIDDVDQVSKIIELYNQATMKNLGKEPPVGENGYIEFVYRNKEKISAGLFVIYESETKNYYSYPDSTIYGYIKQIGQSKNVIPQ